MTREEKGERIREQQAFVEQLSKRTNLNPIVIVGQTRPMVECQLKEFAM